MAKKKSEPSQPDLLALIKKVKGTKAYIIPSFPEGVTVSPTRPFWDLDEPCLYLLSSKNQCFRVQFPKENIDTIVSIVRGIGLYLPSRVLNITKVPLSKEEINRRNQRNAERRQKKNESGR
ncbi:hypothetical protein J6T66_03020 [bacterium]|nr:hypothetical protein [bacterium]